MTRADRQRHEMEQVLRAIGKVEHRSPLLPEGTRKAMTLQGWEASDASGDDFREGVPIDTTLPPPEGPVTVTHARTAAGLIRLSKLSDTDCIRARAFYATTDPPMSLKLVIARGDGQAPITSEVAARKALGDRLPAPRLLEFGADRSMAYLVEPLLFGTHPTSGEKRAVAETLIHGLLAAHRGAGLHDEPPRLHPSTFARMAALFSRMPWDPAWPAPATLIAECAQLVESGSTEAIGWCHGDLVFSNVILAHDGSVHLIDWEHARVGPVAADFAKLVSSSYPPAPVLAVLEASVTSDDIGSRPGRHSVRHQLAISVMRYLSWWEPKRERAASTGRMEILDKWTRRSTDLLIELL